MASGTTEAFASATQALRSFSADLLKSTSNKYWGTEVMATASTGSFWDDDPEEMAKKRVNEMKRKFHSGRQLQIKHLPRDVTEEEIRELLSEFPVQAVQLQCGTGSGIARATLEDPEMLEEWDRERTFLLRGQRVPVSPTPTEMMLCVARLPYTLTEAKFTSLVAVYGEIRRSFLMINDKLGESKGYGFVEYTTKEAALQAKNMLDGKQLDDWILCCDWLDSSHVTFESLHSKCLFVDRLPKDFRDMGEFRKVFSSVVNPPYCQIALKNGCPQDWGLVEFSSCEDAETAQMTLNGYLLRGQNIRICYYIPGVRAINLYLKLLNDSGNKGKAAGLLPDPPGPVVFQQLQNLAKQNPAFAQSLQNIIWTQIQTLQGGSESSKKGNASTGKPKPSTAQAGTGQMSRQSPTQGATSPPGGIEDTQAALVILLATQLQAQMGSNHPSVLGNPQMVNALQTLVKESSVSGHPSVPGHPSIPGHPSLLTQMPPPVVPRFMYGQNHTVLQDARKAPQMKNGFLKPGQPQKVPLLPNPSETISPPPGEVAPRPAFSASVMDDAATGGMLRMPPHIPGQIPIQDPHFWNGLLGHIQNQQALNLPQMEPTVMVKNSFYEQNGLGGPKSPLVDKPNGTHFPQVQPDGPKMSHPQLMKLVHNELGYPDTGSGELHQTLNTIINRAENIHQLLGTLNSVFQGNGSAPTMPGTRQVLLGSNAGYPFANQGPTLLQGPPPSPDTTWAMSVALPVTTRPQPIVTMAGAQTRRPLMASPVAGGRPVLGPSAAQGRPMIGSPVAMPVSAPKPLGYIEVKPNHLRQSPFQNGWAPGPFLTPPTPLTGGGPPQFASYPSPGVVPNLWSHPGSPILISTPPPGLVTPIGQKRKYNRLLPSPEPSPEGNYIGQHSQGLGGHYADSYFKRKKKN